LISQEGWLIPGVIIVATLATPGCFSIIYIHYRQVNVRPLKGCAQGIGSGRETIMRYLYVYDPNRAIVTDQRDVSALGDSEIELLKIDLLVGSHYPLEVLDSAIDAMPFQFGSANAAIATPRLTRAQRN
jgi:hypothetical protein